MMQDELEGPLGEWERLRAGRALDGGVPHSTTRASSGARSATTATGTNRPRRREADRQYCKVRRLSPSSDATLAPLVPCRFARLE